MSDRNAEAKPLHQQHPELMCQVCGGAGYVYQFGQSIPCHVCQGAGVTDVARDGYGEPVAKETP